MINKILFLLPLFIFPVTSTFTQSANTDKEPPNLKFMELHDNTAPVCFESDRLATYFKRAWEKDTQNRGKKFFESWRIKLSHQEFDSLTLKDKFTYAHRYPEQYIQTCSMYEMPEEMTHIYATIPTGGEGMYMSERQKKSVADNRDFMITCLKTCIDFNSHIPLVYKQTILDLNAWDFIPSILGLEDKINKRDTNVVWDHSVYSLLMQLMKNNNFAQLKKTNFYSSLYGPKATYRPKISFTPAIRKQIIDMSSQFYQWKLSGK